VYGRADGEGDIEEMRGRTESKLILMEE